MSFYLMRSDIKNFKNGGSMKEKFDLIIKNGKIVLEDRCMGGNIYIRDGKIACIEDSDLHAEAYEIIDAVNTSQIMKLFDIFQGFLYECTP